jgi:release factor glutamine methyltransferase
MRLRDLAAAAQARFTTAGIPDDEARLDAELLLRHLLQWDRATWLLGRDEPAGPGVEAGLAPLVERRAAREPIAYLRGEQEFYGRAFAVGRGVLIPRPETELVVDEGLAALAGLARPRLLDIGTGSGCLAVTLALERLDARIVATDSSAEALGWARVNIGRFGVESRVVLTHASAAGPVDGPFDLVVSNPPYVREIDRADLQPEVRLHEPAAALFAGADGLDVVRAIVPEAWAALRPGGTLAMEIGAGQDGDATAIVRQAGFVEVRTRRDLQGIARVVIARK